MAGELMAKVGWIRDTAEWGSLIEGRPHAIRGESAVAVMLATNEQTGALRWEAAGDRAFYGYATESTIAPATTATVIDPADDPTPDDWGTGDHGCCRSFSMQLDLLGHNVLVNLCRVFVVRGCVGCLQQVRSNQI
jgi:hypothetical protein